jgi:hypothetical protein
LAVDDDAVHARSTAAWKGFARRLDADMLKAFGPAAARRPRIFVCGDER